VKALTTLNVALIDQTLVVAEKIKIASGDIDSVALAVEFDSAWEEFVNRSASFYTSHDSKPIERLLTDNQCIVPPGVLAKPGILYVGVIGVKADGSSVKTSSYASFRIVQGAEHAYTTVSPELNLYQQYLAATKAEVTPILAQAKADLQKGFDEFTRIADERMTAHENDSGYDLLWENASPTSTFAQQTITLDLSEYTFLFIEHISSGDMSARNSFIMRVGCRYNEGYFWSNIRHNRGIISNSDGITMSDSFGYSSFDASYTDSDLKDKGIVPIAIYGIK
jgi:hypothetical protein